MLDFLNNHEKVAVDASVARGIALSLYGKRHAVGHAGGYVEADELFLAFGAFAVTVSTILCYGFALAVAVRAYRL
jgi:hypothetical protein